MKINGIITQSPSCISWSGICFLQKWEWLRITLSHRITLTKCVTNIGYRLSLSFFFWKRSLGCSTGLCVAKQFILNGAHETRIFVRTANKIRTTTDTIHPAHFASVIDICPQTVIHQTVIITVGRGGVVSCQCVRKRKKKSDWETDIRIGGGGTKGGGGGGGAVRQCSREIGQVRKRGSVCMLEFVWRGTEEGCRWHGAGAGLAHCPLAVPGSICHQQEHLQPKVPLSPSVRVTSLAFPLVQGPRLPVQF